MPATDVRKIRGQAAALTAAVLAFLFTGAPGVAAPQVVCGTDPAAGDAARFPLRVAEGGRYLEDAAGRPFLMHGDTAWSLIAQLDEADAELYLRSRRAAGFNTILVNLIESRFASRAPANIFGETPFAGGDFTRPREAYFRHADWILARACDLGFLVLLTPAYSGNGGGPEGWYAEMEKAGADAMREYGRALGNRYAGLPNILWVQGGDYNPPDKDLIRAFVEGIRSADPDALQTAHGSPGWGAAEYWQGEAWLDVDNVYTYEPVLDGVAAARDRPGGRPFFLMESAYENEHGADALRIRVQAWQAVLGGAFGHVYGNNPMWHFDGPGLYAVERSWQQELDSPGTRSMVAFARIMGGMEWWRLAPDPGFLVDDPSHHGARSIAARTPDGSLAVVYQPIARRTTMNLAALAGPLIRARWIDPTDGSGRDVAGSPFPPEVRTFAPPGPNAGGTPDWLLEFTADSSGVQN
jgi:hypothetical protein